MFKGLVDIGYYLVFLWTNPSSKEVPERRLENITAEFL